MTTWFQYFIKPTSYNGRGGLVLDVWNKSDCQGYNDSTMQRLI